MRQYQAWLLPQGHHVSNAVAHCPPGGYPQAVHGLPPQLVWLPQHFLQGSMPAAYLPQKAALQLQADNSRYGMLFGCKDTGCQLEAFASQKGCVTAKSTSDSGLCYQAAGQRICEAAHAAK